MTKAKKTLPKTKKKTPKVAKTDTVTIVQSLAEELLKDLHVEATTSASETKEGVVNVNIETPESGLLIGFHGETLSSFQLILGLLVYKKLGTWVRVVVEVGDYRQKREEQLKEMAESYANQVVATNQPLTLPYLPPFERRIIHLALQDNPKVATESIGEGNLRRVVVKPKP